MSATYITPAHVARQAGISPDTARSYLRDIDPREAPRLRQRYEPSRLNELVAFCESKRQRRYRNQFNSALIENDGALAIEQGSAS
ncbi:hypothetical protein EON80_09545 [bacterium]|nr:MAG: hypothetical protein EON80_09545 [bacterium]